MKWVQRQRLKTLLIAVAFLAALGVFLWWLNRREAYRNVLTPGRSPSVGSSPSPESAPITPPPLPSASPTAETSPTVTPSADDSSARSYPSPVVQPSGLIIPVAGVRADQLLDTFTAARGEGRVHDAIDIAAPKGTPVLAVAGGKILKLFESKAGGTTIYQLSSDEKFIYYYAHLERYTDGLQEGRTVTQGETIAYVGDTGNAGAGNYHLHFSIALSSNPKRWWEGTYVNPYLLLKQ